MPIIEYMFNIDENGRKTIPGFVKDRGYWYNPADHTYLGWLDSDREYWIPDTIEEKTKAQVVARALSIHASTPFTNPDAEDPESETAMDSAEVTTLIENWYDNMITNNKS